MILSQIESKRRSSPLSQVCLDTFGLRIVSWLYTYNSMFSLDQNLALNANSLYAFDVLDMQPRIPLHLFLENATTQSEIVLCTRHLALNLRCDARC